MRSSWPLSFGQQRLWLTDQLRGGGVEYLVPIAWRLHGSLDTGALRSALNQLVARHQILRTRITAPDGVPVQIVDPPADVPFTLTDHTGETRGSPEVRLRDCLTDILGQPFDLATQWPVKAELIRVAADQHVLVICLHHIACDGWSLDLLARDLGGLYRTAATGQPAQLPALPIQYADYAAWQTSHLTPQRQHDDLEYWRGHLSGHAPFELPTDHRRPEIWHPHGDTLEFDLPPGLTRALSSLARENSATLYMVLLTAFLILLARRTGQSDITVGTPTVGRNREETTDLIGFFVNTLTIRAKVSDELTFREVLRHVRAICLDAYAHQQIPFEKLVDNLAPERTPNRNPFFQILFSMGTHSERELDLPGVRAENLGLLVDSPMFDIAFELTEHPDGRLHGVVNFASALFERSSVERLAGHYSSLLSSSCADPDTTVTQLGILPREEQRAVLALGEGPSVERPDLCLHDLVASRTARTPDAIAVTVGDESLSYAELDARANRLARYLRAAGHGLGDVVALGMLRSADMIVALLAVLKAGCAYLPLDSSHPGARLASMTAEAGAATVLTQAAVADVFGSLPCRSIVLDSPEVAGRISLESSQTPDIRVESGDPAYVIYTSGSTGRPKGITIPHRGIRNHVLWAIERHQLVPSDTVLQKTPLSFDAAAWEILAPLVAGARLVLAPVGAESDPAAMAGCITRHGVTVLQLVPSVLRLFREFGEIYACHSLRLVSCAGEPLRVEACDDLRQRLGIEVTNTYGPTECSIDVASWSSQEGEPHSIAPLGRPLHNTEIRVLDPEGTPVPYGVVGEIYLGGEGLALGYVGQAGLTAERFVPDYCGDRPGSRLYRTGDLGRWRSDGLLEFVGRIDDQVKLHGVRVEPSEVARVLEEHRAVDNAVVMVARADGQEHLTAYVTGSRSHGEMSDLRSHLQFRLPRTMIPSRIVFVDRFPLLPNGKLNRAALLAMEGPQNHEQEPHVPPSSPLEKTIWEVWRTLLHTDRFGVHDGFFTLGGNSLLATLMAFRLATELHRDIPTHLVFRAGTVAGIARALEDERIEYAPAESERQEGSGRPLSFGQQRLWLIDQLREDGAEYLVPVVWRLEGDLDTDVLRSALHQLVARHEVLRTRITAPDGIPVATADLPAELPLGVVDLAQEPDGPADTRVQDVLAESLAQPFDLATQGPIRATLIQLAEDRNLLALCLHHIACDGWSLDILARDLGELYRATVGRRPPQLPALPGQYADHATWQAANLTPRELEAHLVYWRGRLDRHTPVELPTDLARPPVWQSEGHTVEFSLPPHLTRSLTALARQSDATLYMAVLTAFITLLHRHTGQDDIAVGTLTSGRSRPETKDLIGFFVNTIIIRARLAGQPTFRDILRQVRATCLDAYAHQDLPFEKLVEDLRPERTLNRNPLFQILFEWQDVSDGGLAFDETIRISDEDLDWHRAKLDLTLSMVNEPDGNLRGVLTYPVSLFKVATVQRMSFSILQIIQNMAEDPDHLI
ncbi:amino acid adenylation domain-containing protein [Streptomyces sp. NPDC051172]|uniref:amino acid adenylation domain-containing protein n=1 Tax=Streptomyces sp. NPDC051172 TaxID=3155796 RepID=UPI00341D629A